MIQRPSQVLYSIKIQILCETLNGLKRQQQFHEHQHQVPQENQEHHEEKTHPNSNEQRQNETLLEIKTTQKTQIMNHDELFDDSKTSQKMMKLTVS